MGSGEYMIYSSGSGIFANDVRGSRGIVTKFGNMDAEIHEWALTWSKSKLEETLQECVAVAKQICPVRTGWLRDSITYVMAPNGFSGEFGSDAPYALYVESRQHYLQTAADIVFSGGGGLFV